MFENINIPKILKSSLRKGGDFADIFFESRRLTSITCEAGKIEKVISGIDTGAGIRVINNHKTYYAYSNNLQEISLLSLAEKVSKACRSKSQDVTIDLREKKPALNFPIRLYPEKIAMPQKIEAVKKANDRAWGKDKAIKQVKIIYGDGMRKIKIANSEGLLVEDEQISSLFLVQVVASQNGILQTGYEVKGGFLGFELLEENPPEQIADLASSRAILMLGAKKAPGGKMPVVLSSEAGGTMVHEAIGHGLEADLAMEGLSVYSNRLGEVVASPLITVVDDGTIPNKRGSFSFDDEGTPSQKNILVENGVLKGYLYDRLTAMKNGAMPTGNGRRESYHYRPIPRMTNTFIAPGKTPPEDIIKATEKGLFVKKMGGGQVNTVNGDFVFEVSEGYLIEGGKIGKPVRGATMAGNGPEILNKITMVGNDLGFGIGTCGKDGQGAPVADAQPTIRIEEIIVGGGVE